MQADDSSDNEKRRPKIDEGTVPSLLSLERAALVDSSLDMELSGERIERSLIGQIIDDSFKITDILGKGGMSVVYKARWVVLNKVVAVKTMHSHLVSDTNALMRFKQEAQATIALEHPNVVKVYQFGITGGEDSKPYIVMDYLEGESLSDRIKREGRVPVKETLQIFSQVCNALEHAHQKGVIHRDLKPSNIMLLPKDGDKPFIKIVDFGIAKILPQEGEAAHRLTQTGDIFGSPMYMSPEQCMGRTVDVRSDVYAIGCVLYESLGGTPPHLGNNVFETFHKHITEIPASLQIPGADKALLNRLDAIIFKALEKEPDKRYQTMGQFEKDINSVLASLESGVLGTDLKYGIESGIARQQRSFLRFLRATPKTAFLYISLALLLVGAASFAWSKSSWFFESHSLAATPTHWIDFLKAKKKKVDLSPEEKQRRLDDGKLASYYSTLLHKEDSYHVAQQFMKRAQICAQIDAPADELAARSRVIDILESLKMDEDLIFVRQAEPYAECLFNQGNVDRAKIYLEKIQLLREKLKMADENPKTYLLLGYIYEQIGEKIQDPTESAFYLKRALRQLDEAEKILRRVNSSTSDSRQTAIVYALRGDGYKFRGVFPKAIKEYDLAETLLASVHSDKNRIMLKELALVLAWTNLQQKNYEVAKKYYARAYGYAKSRFENEAELQHFLDGYAVAAWNTGDILHAIELHEQALAAAH